MQTTPVRIYIQELDGLEERVSTELEQLRLYYAHLSDIPSDHDIHANMQKFKHLCRELERLQYDIISNMHTINRSVEHENKSIHKQNKLHARLSSVLKDLQSDEQTAGVMQSDVQLASNGQYRHNIEMGVGLALALVYMGALIAV